MEINERLTELNQQLELLYDRHAAHHGPIASCEDDGCDLCKQYYAALTEYYELLGQRRRR